MGETGARHTEVLGPQPQKLLLVRNRTRCGDIALILHFGNTEASATIFLKEGRWVKRLDSAELQWHGPGSAVPETVDVTGEISLTLNAQTVVLLVREET